MAETFVPIIMGSKSDLEHGKAVQAALHELGIDSDIRVASAHKAPRYLMELLTVYEADGRPKVYVTIAGRSNALSALICGQVRAPVIACPPYSASFGGADIYSSLRMPSGVAPLVVIDARNAAFAAAKILALADGRLRARVAAAQEAHRLRIVNDDASINP